VGEKNSGGIIIPIHDELRVLSPMVHIHPEAAAYTFGLEGCPRKLFWFILLYKLDIRTGEFPFNAQTTQQFQEYCSIFESSPYTAGVVKKARRTLVERNIIQSLKREHYMMNPLIAGGTNDDTRRILIAKYNGHLLDKGKSAPKYFLPAVNP
jgi:hypothetical protein